MAIVVTGTSIYIPQSLYNSNAKNVELKEPIIFVASHSDQWGVALEDALRERLGDLHGRKDYMFEDCGPGSSCEMFDQAHSAPFPPLSC